MKSLLIFFTLSSFCFAFSKGNNLGKEARTIRCVRFSSDYKSFRDKIEGKQRVSFKEASKSRKSLLSFLRSHHFTPFHMIVSEKKVFGQRNIFIKETILEYAIRKEKEYALILNSQKKKEYQEIVRTLRYVWFGEVWVKVKGSFTGHKIKADGRGVEHLLKAKELDKRVFEVIRNACQRRLNKFFSAK